MRILYDEKLEEPPPADRLRVMITALASGAEIDASLRAELIDALKRHDVRRRNDEQRSARGRGVAIHTFTAASLAKELHDNHGISSIKAATAAAFESVKAQMGLTSEITLGAVRRTYRKLSASPDGSITTGKGNKVMLALLSDSYIADAMARLPQSSKSGNK